MKDKETLEEAIIRYKKDYFNPANLFDEAIELGAKWQQERSYSEEEVLPIVEYIQWVIRKADRGDTPEEIVRLLLFYRDKIEQFKKK